jgi:hypothetical protein
MNQYAHLREMCKHDAYRPVVMLGSIIHWRCRCGRIVAAPHMSDKVIAYIHYLQALAVARRKRAVLSQTREAEFAAYLNACRHGMTTTEEQFIDMVVSEFSCLRSKPARKPTCLDERVV